MSSTMKRKINMHLEWTHSQFCYLSAKRVNSVQSIFCHLLTLTDNIPICKQPDWMCLVTAFGFAEQRECLLCWPVHLQRVSNHSCCAVQVLPAWSYGQLWQHGWSDPQEQAAPGLSAAGTHGGLSMSSWQTQLNVHSEKRSPNIIWEMTYWCWIKRPKNVEPK